MHKIHKKNRKENQVYVKDCETLLYPRVVQLIVEPQDQIVQLVVQLRGDAQARNTAGGFCDN